MNFNFNVNGLLPYEITKFNSEMRIINPDNNNNMGNQQLSREMVSKVAHIIDQIGLASSKVILFNQ
jgi:hypothetical protein